MSEYRTTLTMRPPNPVQRSWYLGLGAEPPVSASELPDHGDLARLVPYSERAFHHWYATIHGYFWLPCPLCDRHFGGHETGGSVPDPVQGEPYWIGICSQCTRKRNA